MRASAHTDDMVGAAGTLTTAVPAEASREALASSSFDVDRTTRIRNFDRSTPVASVSK
jgi:hypothetical protein